MLTVFMKEQGVVAAKKPLELRITYNAYEGVTQNIHPFSNDNAFDRQIVHDLVSTQRLSSMKVLISLFKG